MHVRAIAEAPATAAPLNRSASDLTLLPVRPRCAGPLSPAATIALAVPLASLPLVARRPALAFLALGRGIPIAHPIVARIAVRAAHLGLRGFGACHRPVLSFASLRFQRRLAGAVPGCRSICRPRPWTARSGAAVERPPAPEPE